MTAQAPDALASPALDRLLAVACGLGYRVEFVATDDIPYRLPLARSRREASMVVTGHIDYGTRTIELATEGVTATEIALTLAHELGHAIAAVRMGYGLQHHNEDWLAALWNLSTGERRAYLYGWAVLVSVGLAPRAVTREAWRHHHIDNWHQIDPAAAGGGF